MTRVIAQTGCSVELALVSTEHGKANDVLHIRRAKRKLTESEQQALHAELDRVLSGASGWQ
jgi:UTP:GlnB (protein PII) uridylyltransferase